MPFKLSLTCAVHALLFSENFSDLGWLLGVAEVGLSLFTTLQNKILEGSRIAKNL